MHLSERLAGVLHLLKGWVSGIATVATSLIKENKFVFSSTYDLPQYSLDIPILKLFCYFNINYILGSNSAQVAEFISRHRDIGRHLLKNCHFNFGRRKN